MKRANGTAEDCCGIDISLNFNCRLCVIPDKMVLQSGVAYMTKEQAHTLGNYVRSKRESKHLPASVLASHAGVAAAQILRIERGEVAAPQATVLGLIADRLGVPINDLFVLAGYPTSRSLPTIEPYLRAQYPRLNAESVTRIADLIHHENVGK